VFVEEKQIVAKDAPLLQIDDHLVALRERQAELAVDAADLQLTKAEAGVAQYEAKRAQAEAALEAANNKVAAAQFALDRKQELVDKEFINRVEVEVAQAQLNEARALVKAEQSRLAELGALNPETEVKLARLEQSRSRTQLEESQQDRREYLLRAPVEGQVLRMQVEQGDLIGPTSPRPAVLLAPKGPWIVRAEVSQEFASLVEEGAVAEVEDEAALGVLAKGTVSETSDVFLPRRQLSDLPNAVITGVAMECVIELQGEHKPLRVGQRVRVRIFDKPHAGTAPDAASTEQ
jgi:multidrug resistance efflux pump